MHSSSWKTNRKGPNPILVRFLQYSDRLKFWSWRKVKRYNYENAVFEDIPKELYNLCKAQMSKFKEAKRRGLKEIFHKAQPDYLFIRGKFIPANDPFLDFSLCCCLYLF